MKEERLRSLSELARRLGIEKHAAKTYLSFTSAIRSQLKESLEELDFEEISTSEHEMTAFFPEFYSTDYRTTLHGIIAHGLNYRGVGSVFVFGDGSLGACKGNMSQYEDNCVRCVHQSNEFAELMNIPDVFLDEINYDDSVKRDEIESKIEDYAVSSTYRALQIAEIDYENPEHVQLLEQFKRTGRIAWDVTDKLHKEYDFDYFVSTGSSYLPRGMALEYAKINDIPITASSDPIYGDGQDLMFSRLDGPLTHYISDKSWRIVEQRPLGSDQERELDEFMGERMETVEQTQYADSGESLELEEDTEMYSMYTHLPWDAAIRDVSRLFDDQYEWVRETVELFETFDDKHLVIKVHPAEKMRGTEQSITDILDSTFDELPDNTTLLEPDTDVDPYELMRSSDIVLVYTSTVGMEATYLDTPVITTADSHYAGKGFTYDPETKDEYRKLIDSGSSELELDERMSSLVRKYLYNYFIQRPISFDLVLPNSYSSEESIIENLESIESLKPGGDAVLDDICKAIIENTSYFYTKTHQ
ncbi:Capsule polysaccharide biosynthesis protein [Halopiger xanaduensis SH-6]|uniref:Capsule polysaccharide biosynthesis protein n=2 Tax=Halopiger xanaduensis TaxID=387343 RepID=F8DAP1_HALXS|nr:Capsule polysaccharide biosynthesis protein [Halopiger xanaduensis SH-6]